MKERNATLLMLLASFLWGMTFVAQSEASGLVESWTYNGVRFLIGAVILQPLSIKAYIKHKEDKQYKKTLLIGGIVTGIFICLASYTQQYGIAFTTAGKAGFITSLYTLFVPIFSLVLKKKVDTKTWICVAIGLLGAYMLAMGSGNGINKGDIWIFSCAILFALQIMAIDYFGKDQEGVDLSAMQFIIGGIISLVLAFATENISFAAIRSAAVPILYAGICSCGIAYTLQIIGQKYVPAAKATLALSTESAWAAVGGFVLLGERMLFKEVCGCLMLFSAVVISQIKFKKQDK